MPLVVRPLASGGDRLAGFFVMASLCAIGCANTSGSTDIACHALAPGGTAAAATPWSGTIFTIVMENHSRGDIVGSPDARYINELIAQGALAAGYHDSFVHPSEPNYLWMVAGENFGVLDDADPPSHHLDSTSHLVDQIEAAGLTWKAYEEGMGAPCGLRSHGRYAAKHDPFVYFDDVNGWDGAAFHPELRCDDHVVDFSQLDTDLAAGTLPKYAFITPNLDDDMHDGSVAAGDAWLEPHVGKILASDEFETSGALFLLWDEGGGTPAADDPPFVVVSPNAKTGFVSRAVFDTSSYLKTVEAMLGLQPLPCDVQPAAIATMDELFAVPLQ